MTRSIDTLRKNARLYQELASNALTEEGRSVLNELADRYEDEAIVLERAGSQGRGTTAFRWQLDDA